MIFQRPSGKQRFILWRHVHGIKAKDFHEKRKLKSIVSAH